ncbi:hypothetical protein HNQ64_003738 [Prosthecobacter dejongeii]|uniref:Uncharacterized protein n=1 Tax=Prosthecobacter dejongeii TaxID=48465 RepID=A0A7W7YNJ8_9BACT|nr:hypothetical protein [Prosthecobacter dejongeii]
MDKFKKSGILVKVSWLLFAGLAASSQVFFSSDLFGERFLILSFEVAH